LISENHNWIDLLSAEVLGEASDSGNADDADNVCDADNLCDATSAVPAKEILSDCMWSLDAKEQRHSRCPF
jgi:hypothetical protein